ncbi:hypothetical protein AALA79_16195 [Lachnospiraceae bacterium 64-25]|nr:hypothetical protein IMSAGC005_03845 [Lachnospiraceae bacterium]
MRKRGTFIPNTNKTIQQLNLEDDSLFAKVMSDKEVCRKVLEKILGVSIREVSVPATQKTINTLYDGKGIRLDVYLNDNEGTVYNVEMEVEHMTLLQKDRENIELGHIEDTISATKILKLHNKGMNNESIALSLQLDIEYVNSFISDYEND